MVFGKPWNDNTEHDWLTRLRTDAHLQKLLIEYGACKSLPLLISAAGFGLGGIVGGSFAAAAHSYLGPIAAKSLFAFLQSAGAGGAAAETLSAICNTGTARNAVGMAFRSKNDERGDVKRNKPRTNKEIASSLTTKKTVTHGSTV